MSRGKCDHRRLSANRVRAPAEAPSTKCFPSRSIARAGFDLMPRCRLPSAHATRANRSRDQPIEKRRLPKARAPLPGRTELPAYGRSRLMMNDGIVVSPGSLAEFAQSRSRCLVWFEPENQSGERTRLGCRWTRLASSRLAQDILPTVWNFSVRSAFSARARKTARAARALPISTSEFGLKRIWLQ